MKTTLLDPTAAEDLAFLQGFSPAVGLAAPQSDDEAELMALLPGSVAIATRRRTVDAALIETAGSSLRFVQLASSRPYLVDIAAARRRDIVVSTMPQVGCIAVAELAVTLMLGLSKKIVRGHEETRRGAYRELGLTPELTGERKFKFQWMKLPDLFELNGTTLGLVGFGEIASEVARRARAFGMSVLYTKRQRLTPEAEAQESVTYKDLPNLLAESDFVSLHVPHTPATDGLIDAAALGAMKPSAYLINTCRGGVVDENALVAALADSRIAGAGLDVFACEPIAHDNPLLGLDNVLLAPHIGGGSGGARKKHADDLMRNLERAAKGERPQHILE